VNASDGIVRDAAFATMVIGGVSTVLFNGNPLMRFDAYYALADLLEIPGLAARGNALLAWYANRSLLGAKTRAPSTSRGEKGWLVGYAIASGIYRWFVSIAIVLWLAHLSLALGTVVGAFVAWRLVVAPIVKLARHVVHSPALDASRKRAFAALGTVGAVAALALFVVPMPFSTRAQGVVWVPEQANIRVAADGFVDQVLARDGEPVVAGQPIVVMREPQLLADWIKARARLGALDAAYQAVLVRNAAEARRIEGEITKTEGDIAATAERLARLTVRAGTDGTLSLPRAQDLPGAFLAKGTLVAHALSDPQVRVRVALPQSDVALVRDRTAGVQVRLADSVATVHEARLLNETPAATRELPSAAMGDRAGGPFPIEAGDADGTRSAEPVFIVDLAVDSSALRRVGGRVWVRFDHGSAPIAYQLWRRTQQVFLRLVGGDRALPVPRT
jgi:putative peptide zinc metalloprotease protein